MIFSFTVLGVIESPHHCGKINVEQFVEVRQKYLFFKKKQIFKELQAIRSTIEAGIIPCQKYLFCRRKEIYFRAWNSEELLQLSFNARYPKQSQSPNYCLQRCIQSEVCVVFSP